MLSSLDVVVVALLSPSSTFENDVVFALLCRRLRRLPNTLIVVALLLLLLCDFVELPKLMSESSTHTRTHAVTLRVKPSSKVRSLVGLRCALSRLPMLRSLCFCSLSRDARKLLRQIQLKRPSSSSSTLTSQFIFSVRSMRFSSSSSVVVRSASSPSTSLLTLLLTVVLIVLPRTL